MPFTPPSLDCPLCPRLCAFHDKNRALYPAFHNAPVPSFGALEAELLIVGLAPGLKGANATGRPFTGDYAGKILYPALLAHGFAEGRFAERADDGLRLLGCRITNAVRCVPPENKPEPGEIKTCLNFLKSEIAAMPNLAAIVALGTVAHGSVLRALGAKPSQHPFAHGAAYNLPRGGKTIRVTASYHCSKYNIFTKRLTPEMFGEVIAGARAALRLEEREIVHV